ncbi:MAG: hypothetical protein N2Z60_09505, partial [Elusimicrobiales bacterium]|nr:hypothetical protein [Elusimicrobiales bacterium]
MLTFCFKLFNIFISVFLLLIPLKSLSQTTTTTTIMVVYPWEGKNIPNVSKSFVFGKIVPYISTITINNQLIKTYPNGTFIAYVSISSADPAFIIDAGGIVYKRSVNFLEKKRDITEENPFEILSSSFIAVMRGSD